jgi:hypothetical protein
LLPFYRWKDPDETFFYLLKVTHALNLDSDSSWSCQSFCQDLRQWQSRMDSADGRRLREELGCQL